MLIRRSKNQKPKIYIPRIITLHPPISYIKEILRDRERERANVVLKKEKRKGKRKTDLKLVLKLKNRFDVYLKFLV
jgi:hypothetical protein